MKFNIDGREYEDYQLSNEQIVSLIENGSIMGSEKAYLMEKAYQRFKSEACAKRGEGRDELFANQFSNYVNRCPNDFKKAASAMGKEHRYLQQEMFKVCLEYFKVLESAYLNNMYDVRNEWAARTANKALSLLRADNWVI